MRGRRGWRERRGGRGGRVQRHRGEHGFGRGRGCDRAGRRGRVRRHVQPDNDDGRRTGQPDIREPSSPSPARVSGGPAAA